MSPAVRVLPLLIALTACQLTPPRPQYALVSAPQDPEPAPAAAPAAPAAPEGFDAPAIGAGHQDGDSMMVVHLQYGVPILQKAIFWDGNAEVDDFGIGVSNYWFVSNSFAWSATLNGTVFKTADGDVYAGEIELGGRWYVWDIAGGGVFWDTTGGYQQSHGAIPPGGTEWNYTFSFGPGIDLPLTRSSGFVAGVTFHHMSNALGRNTPRDPSQNEGRFHFGFGWEG